MPALLKTTQIQEASSATVNLALDTSGGVTVGQNLTVTGNQSMTGTVVMGSPFTMRNKIINGAMVIDQRSAGASSTVTSSSYYSCDRWQEAASVSSKYSVQQNAGSVTPPAGFTNYLGVTSLSAYSVLAGDFFVLAQYIEGYNVADLAWGTANAKAVTLSFQVYSSLTGTFGGCIGNNGQTRSYPFSFTVSAANTWTSVSVTIPGDTTGTWLTNSGRGVTVYFNLGSGSTYSGTNATWASAQYFTPTGAVSVVGTNGATFYITGVQLERGTVATPFEYRNYQQELAMCQRYFCKTFDVTTAPAQNSTAVGAIWGSVRAFGGAAGSSWEPQAMWFFPVTMRAAPTVTVYAAYAGITSGQWGNSSTVSAANTRVLNTGMTSAVIDNTGNTVAFGNNSPNIQLTASIEL